MKPAVLLLALALLPLSVHAAPSPSSDSSGTITVTRTADGKGFNITLPSSRINTVTDRFWLTIDGSTQEFGGDFYTPEFYPKMPLRYIGSVSSDLDGQVKDILKAQGLPVKENVTTYQIMCGVNSPNSISVSKSLSFRHVSNLISYPPLPFHAVYKIGDKITLFEAVALDSSATTSGILGKSVEKQNQAPHDLLHRITLQVQFVPKAKEVGAAKEADKKRGQG